MSKLEKKMSIKNSVILFLTVLAGCSEPVEIIQKSEPLQIDAISLTALDETRYETLDETITRYERTVGRLLATGRDDDMNFARHMRELLDVAYRLRDSPFVYRSGRINIGVPDSQLTDVHTQQRIHAQTAADYLQGRIADGRKVLVESQDGQIVVAFQGLTGPDLLGGGLIMVRVYVDAESGEALHAVATS